MRSNETGDNLPKLSAVVDLLNGIAAFASAESWDNVGLLVGDAESLVSGIMVALDATEEVLEEAIDSGCNLVVTHHPVIFRPLAAIRTDQPGGRLIARALAARVAMVGCHTNLDVANHGVSGELAAILGLSGCSPIGPGGRTSDENEGFGRIGDLPEAVAGVEFVRLLLAATGVGAVRMAGPLPAFVRRVAVCGGSGSELAEAAKKRGADLFVTGEIKHSAARWAEANGFCLIDAGHYATEQPIVSWLARHLSQKLAAAGFAVEVRESCRLKEPFTWYATAGSVVTIG